jgi:CubicO group peptidase (beta-lactamase class C family)
MTKLVTGVAIMQLVEQNLLSLDDDARDYVPELRGIQILRDMGTSISPASSFCSEICI